ncbi:hypothetical protein OG552_10205 [Streptomyces sp. NBC_01476]|uniref:hypothetical protein n=1 Tax=Streptomyces sp. NBC_01476 TaxID=2903881 RepID=UPI002E2EE058|nr:hypothetical protein [Streptomyces sp. NBC_01476]
MSAAVAAPNRHRFALTRRQLRDRVTHLKTLLARTRDQAAHDAAQADRDLQAAHEANHVLRARLAAADELIRNQQQQLHAQGVDLSVTRKQLQAAEAMGRRVGDDLRAAQAALANHNRVDVPPMVRDTSDALDQPTVPVPVMTLHAALGRTA